MDEIPDIVTRIGPWTVRENGDIQCTLKSFAPFQLNKAEEYKEQLEEAIQLSREVQNG